MRAEPQFSQNNEGHRAPAKFECFEYEMYINCSVIFIACLLIRHLMNDKALNYIHQTHGWKIGVGPAVVVVNEGVAKNLSSTTLKDDAYAFIFDQQGLMASLSIEGTKITHIHNP